MGPDIRDGGRFGCDPFDHRVVRFGDRARRSSNSKLPVQDAFYVSPEQVVRDSLRALSRGRARIYPGLKVAVAAVGIGLLPICALRFVMSFRPRRS